MLFRLEELDMLLMNHLCPYHCWWLAPFFPKTDLLRMSYYIQNMITLLQTIMLISKVNQAVKSDT